MSMALSRLSEEERDAMIENSEQMVMAICAVIRKELALSSSDDPTRVLSPREKQVARELARGLTNREIATQIGISVKTIDTHRGHALKKLRLRNNSDITRFAIQHGLISL